MPLRASVLLAGLCSLAACTPNQLAHASQAKRTAAAAFECGLDQLTIEDEGAEVYLVEGCGQIASFYCTEDASLRMKCERVTDPGVIAAHGNLSDALAAQDKREAAERQRAVATGASPSAAAKAAAEGTPQPPQTGADSVTK